MSSRILAVAFLTLLVGCTRPNKEAPVADGGVALTSAVMEAGVAAAAEVADAGEPNDDSALPLPTSPELTTRMHHLLEAIAQSNAELAADVVFPREAFIAVKDAPDPQKLWERKLSNTFRRAVERTHKRARGVQNAKFVSFELGRSVVQVPPKRRDFKKALWRVKRSKLTYEIDGRPHEIVIAEMMAWRGAWYVTRLR